MYELSLGGSQFQVQREGMIFRGCGVAEAFAGAIVEERFDLAKSLPGDVLVAGRSGKELTYQSVAILVRTTLVRITRGIPISLHAEMSIQSLAPFECL